METIFESENITFVNVHQSLVNDYLTMVNDIEHVGRYIGNRQKPYSFEEEQQFIQSKLENHAPMFSMLEINSGEFIGNIEIMDIKDDCGELGIAITTKKQDMGYGSEAIRRMIDYAFKVLRLKKIILKVYPYNERAIHVYEKCGFTKYAATDAEVFMETLCED